MSATAAITTAINAKFATAPVKTLKQAQTATSDYIVLFVSRRYVADRYVSGEVTIPGGRVTVRCVCMTEANLEVYRARVQSALENQILPDDVGPFVFETETDTALDSTTSGTTVFVADSQWTY